MVRRRASVFVALACAVLLTSGCSGSPAPAVSTSAPLFANEDDAFAAAEKTYRAYVDALNAVDLSDPATFEPVFALTTGEANAAARQSFSQMHADGWTVSGVSLVETVTPVSAELDTQPTVAIVACLDVADVAVTNEHGESMVDDSRPDVQTIGVNLVGDSGTATGLIIAAFDGVEDGQCD